jgi:hypothetical protein
MAVLSRLRALLRSLVGGRPRQYERQLPPGEPRRTDSLVRGVEDGTDLVGSLRDGGILVQQGQDLVVSDPFRAGWRTEMDTLRGMDDDALANAVGSSAPGVEASVVAAEDGRDFLVVGSGDDQLWVSRPVAIAEVGAMRALPESVPPDHRLAAPRPLRLFLEECPDCQGRADFVDAEDWPASDHPDEDAGEYLVCYDCGETLYSR